MQRNASNCNGLAVLSLNAGELRESMGKSSSVANHRGIVQLALIGNDVRVGLPYDWLARLMFETPTAYVDFETGTVELIGHLSNPNFKA